MLASRPGGPKGEKMKHGGAATRIPMDDEVNGSIRKWFNPQLNVLYLVAAIFVFHGTFGWTVVTKASLVRY